MNVCVDTRPLSELSVAEVVAYWFRAFRAQQATSVAQVRQIYKALFPEATPAQAKEHLTALARTLHPTSGA